MSKPPSELLVPLNDLPPVAPSPVAGARQRRSSRRTSQRSSRASEEMEKVSKLRIDLDEGKKAAKRKSFMSPTFRFNSEMALRVAAGVLIASFVLLKEKSDYAQPDPKHPKKWLLFPQWYYLGGLSYCAVAVIFSAKTNVGATTREVWQAFCGVGMALIYNIIVFALIHLEMAPTSTSANVTSGFTEITKTFNMTPYWVNVTNYYKVLPWMMLFTIFVLLIPIEPNTRKFALANNLFFALTILNPTDPTDAKKVKSSTDTYFSTHNVLKNLEMYFLVGFMGTLISFVIMFIPYPVFAIKRLMTETKRASSDIANLLNIIVDSYCFKNKNVENMNFLRAKLHLKFEEAAARHRKMLELQEDVWWEQLFGFHILLGFNLSIFKNFIRLYGSLLADLRTLNWAMQLEQYGPLHNAYMKGLQREIYMTQLRSGDLLDEISDNVHRCVRRLELQHQGVLDKQMEQTLRHYRATQNSVLRKQKPSLKEVEGNVPLNLFLFSLNSYCTTLLDFQDAFNKKDFNTKHRAKNFLVDTIKKFFVFKRYNRLMFLSAFKVSVAIFAGVFIAVFVFSFSNTTPASVAYVMGSHIGGSFSLTVNRVAGVVAGSVVPSVFQFFSNQVCSPHNMNIVLSDITLVVWVTISMYVRYSGGYGSYAGVVSAFISAGILLKQPDKCGGDSTALSISSYSSMAQTSVGIILFIIIELALCPESAASLLRENIQQTLKHLRETFDVLFDHHMTSDDEITEEKLEKLRKILQITVPALIADQKKLLAEADAEPSLWKPQFSYKKYEAVIHNCERLLSNNSLLFKLVKWFNRRVEQHKIDPATAVDIRNVMQGPDLEDSKDRQWIDASNHFEKAVDDTFDTLDTLFGKDFFYADTEETAIFMQMKEAFRLADSDGSGEIDAGEVSIMLNTIFAESGCAQSEIDKYVQDFMEVVDKDHSGKVSFEEFMEALENGLTLEVEVYNRQKPKLLADASKASRMPTISEAEASRHSATSPVATPRNAASESAQLSPMARAIRRSLSPSSSPVMRRQHDVLNVEEFALGDMASSMKASYVAWLMENNRFEHVTMEELLLLNCLVSGAEGIARNLTTIQEIVVSQ